MDSAAATNVISDHSQGTGVWGNGDIMCGKSPTGVNKSKRSCLSQAHVAQESGRRIDEKLFINDVGHGMRSLAGIVVGVPYEYCVRELSAEAMRAWACGCRVLAQAGAHLVPISLPHTRYALSVYYTVGPAEASSNLARFNSLCYGRTVGDLSSRCSRAQTSPTKRRPGNYWRTNVMGARKYLLGPEVRRRILIGSFVLSTCFFRKYYDKAVILRQLISRDFNVPPAHQSKGVLARVCARSVSVDTILTPTITAAPRLSSEIERIGLEQVYMDDILTAAASLAGLPAIAIPSGTRRNNETCDVDSEHPPGYQRCRPPSTLHLIGCARSVSRHTASAPPIFMRCAAVLETAAGVTAR